MSSINSLQYQLLVGKELLNTKDCSRDVSVRNVSPSISPVRSSAIRHNLCCINTDTHCFPYMASLLQNGIHKHSFLNKNWKNIHNCNHVTSSAKKLLIVEQTVSSQINYFHMFAIVLMVNITLGVTKQFSVNAHERHVSQALTDATHYVRRLVRVSDICPAISLSGCPTLSTNDKPRIFKITGA